MRKKDLKEATDCLVLYYFSPSTKCQNHCTTYCCCCSRSFISGSFEAFLLSFISHIDIKRLTADGLKGQFLFHLFYSLVFDLLLHISYVVLQLLSNL